MRGPRSRRRRRPRPAPCARPAALRRPRRPPRWCRCPGGGPARAASSMSRRKQAKPQHLKLLTRGAAAAGRARDGEGRGRGPPGVGGARAPRTRKVPGLPRAGACRVALGPGKASLGIRSSAGRAARSFGRSKSRLGRRELSCARGGARARGPRGARAASRRPARQPGAGGRGRAAASAPPPGPPRLDTGAGLCDRGAHSRRRGRCPGSPTAGCGPGQLCSAPGAPGGALGADPPPWPRPPPAGQRPAGCALRAAEPERSGRAGKPAIPSPRRVGSRCGLAFPNGRLGN